MGQGYSKMKKQARQLQEQMGKMQEELDALEVEGSAGNGLVQVLLSGQGDLKKIKISPECVDPEDVEGLEDLIEAAFKNGKSKVADQSALMEGLGGLSLGNLPLSL